MLTLLIRQEYQQGQKYKKFLPKSMASYQTAAHNAIDARIDAITLCAFETILMQGPEPTAYYWISTRMVLLSVSTFSLMLLQFYGAFIVGSLLAAVPRTITSLDALYNSSLDIGMENISYIWEIFNSSTFPIEHGIYAERICKMPVERQIMKLEDGVERIGRGGFAFFVGLDQAYRILKCK